MRTSEGGAGSSEALGRPRWCVRFMKADGTGCRHPVHRRLDEVTWRRQGVVVFALSVTLEAVHVTGMATQVASMSAFDDN
jgi:hypothetical protein